MSWLSIDGKPSLIVSREGPPIVASTVIGGGLNQRNIQVFAGILEFGLDARLAVSAPALLLPDSIAQKMFARVRDGEFNADALRGVRSLGL